MTGSWKIFVRLAVVCVWCWGMHPLSLKAQIAVQVLQTPALGLKVWHHEDHRVPVVSLVMSFQAGGSYVPKGKAGLAALLADLLMEGAGEFTTQAFHEKLETFGIELDATADRDRLVIQLRTPKEHLEQALTLLRLVLHHPRFDPDAFNRLKKRALAWARNQRSTPRWIAARHLDKSLYGNHPYVLPVEGNLSSLEAIQAGDVASFMKAHVSLDHVLLAASGDITNASLGQALDTLLKGLPLKGPQRTLPPLTLPEPGTFALHKTSHSQAVVLFAHKGLPHAHKDFMKLYLLDHVLGGGSMSRLTQELREKAGLVYDVRTAATSHDAVALFLGVLGTKGTSVHQALHKIKTLVDHVRQEGVTQQELDLAKKHLIGRFPMSFTSSKKSAQTLHAYQVYRFPPDYIETRNARFRSLTLQEVNTFAKDFLNPENLFFSVAGDVPDPTPSKRDTRPSSHRTKGASTGVPVPSP